ncbi:MAG TPA: hypothetical protein VFP68_02015 [Burkholderiaceae bacterium]|nr:hypothetical protein [Burkholderiaceae bacterium]
MPVVVGDKLARDGFVGGHFIPAHILFDKECIGKALQQFDQRAAGPSLRTCKGDFQRAHDQVFVREGEFNDRVLRSFGARF